MGEDLVRALCGVIETDAGLELDAGSLDVVIKCRADRADARLYIAAAREQREIIRGETPDESVWEMLAEEAGNGAQAFVALGDAADGVQPAEIRDVEIDGNFFEKGAVFEVSLRVLDSGAEERVHAGQSRQSVCLIGAAARIGADERHVVGAVRGRRLSLGAA